MAGLPAVLDNLVYTELDNRRLQCLSFLTLKSKGSEGTGTKALRRMSCIPR